MDEQKKTKKKKEINLLYRRMNQLSIRRKISIIGLRKLVVDKNEYSYFYKKR